MREIWKDIKGYEGHYQVSNFGRIKSLYFKNKYGIINREKILKLGFNGRYYQVALSYNGKIKVYQVHRIVAKAFIDNPNNYKYINHINGIKTDNKVENLEWCTQSYNIKEAYKNGLIKLYKGEENYHYNKPSKRRIQVIQYDLDDNFIKCWDYAEQIEKKLEYKCK